MHAGSVGEGHLADHITTGIDVVVSGFESVVDLDMASLGQFDADRVQVQVGGIWPTSDRNQHLVGGDTSFVVDDDHKVTVGC